MLNAITLRNSRYLGLAVEHLRAEGGEVRDEDVERLSPLRFEHIHLEGRYAFTLAEAVKQGGLRPLRDPDDVLNEYKGDMPVRRSIATARPVRTGRSGRRASCPGGD